jgi:hypothetical protein
MSAAFVTGQVVSASSGSASTQTSGAFPGANTIGNTIVVLMAGYNGTGTLSVTDLHGNTYTQIGSYYYGETMGAAFSAPVTVGGSGNTVKVVANSGPFQYCFFAAEYSSVILSSPGYSFAGASGVVEASPQTVSFTPAAAGDLVLALGPAPANNDSTGVAPGCTQRGSFTAAPTVSALAEIIASSTSPVSIGFTTSSTEDNAIMVVGLTAATPVATVASKLGGLRSFSQASTSTPAIGASPGMFDASMQSATLFDRSLNQGVFDADLIAPTGNTIASRLGGLRSSATVAESIPSTVAQKVGGLRSSATVAETIPSTVAQRLAGLRSSATVAEINPSTIAQRLGGLRSSATVAEGIGATVAQRLGGLRSSATVGVTGAVSSTIAQNLGGLRSSVTVAESIAASVAQRLGGLRSSASVSESIGSTVEQILGGLRSSVTAYNGVASEVACVLGGLRSSVTVGVINPGSAILGARGVTSALAFPVGLTESVPGPVGTTLALANPGAFCADESALQGATVALPYPVGVTWPL